MKKFFVLIVTLLNISAYAQFEPRIVLNDKKELKLSFLDIQVEVVGNYALSTYTMKFHNSYNRTLEGELNFPLLQGQSIVGFEMEVNGVLRKAVVVEKEKGRVAYETVVRGNIDPGLLEKTVGNNYKVRVYPINPNSDKLIKVIIEEPLRSQEGKNELTLNFDSKTVIDHFSLAIDVVGGELLMDDDAKKLGLTKTSLKNHQIVRMQKKQQLLSNIKGKFYNCIESYPVLTTSENYFNGTVKVNTPDIALKKHQKLTLVWDSSYSMLNRNLDKELKFLTTYFKTFPNLEVELIVFSNKVHTIKKITIKNGEWDALKEELMNTKYDGATDYEVLGNVKFFKEILMFTDGLGSFENAKFLQGNVNLVNASTKANHDLIYTLGGDTPDIYVNLNNTSIASALDQVKTPPVQFMGYKNNSDVWEVYHDFGLNAGGLFSISGRFDKDTELVLMFGDGNSVSFTEVLSISKGVKKELSTRVWAKMKLKALERKKKANKQKIINHAKEFKLVTDETSLIVLDRLQDYLRYRIEPPAELQEAYKQGLRDRELEDLKTEKELKAMQKDVVEDAKTIYKWYNKKNKKSQKDTLALDELVVESVNDDEVSPEFLEREEDVNTLDRENADQNVPPPPLRVSSDIESISLGEVSLMEALQGRISGVQITNSIESLEFTENEDDTAINLKAWDPKTPYLLKLKKTKSIEQAYELYYRMRTTYSKTPTFFMDVANYFFQKNADEYGVLILSNLLEMDLNNYELLKAMAYQLEAVKNYDLAVKVYQKIIEIRSEDPQSYRDLALAYEEVGEVQKAFDLLYRVYSGEFLKKDLEDHRFDGIEQISFVELSRLFFLYKNSLKLTSTQQKEFKSMNLDIRVLVDWNHNDTDLDLWVIDPNGEKCYYSNTKTKIGGRMSNDMINGFGPEEFMLKTAIKGTYTIKVKYYSDTKQKISGPTALKLTTIINYGLPSEIKKIQTYRLKSKSEVLEVGRIVF